MCVCVRACVRVCVRVCVSTETTVLNKQKCTFTQHMHVYLLLNSVPMAKVASTNIFM